MKYKDRLDEDARDGRPLGRGQLVGVVDEVEDALHSTVRYGTDGTVQYSIVNYSIVQYSTV